MKRKLSWGASFVAAFLALGVGPAQAWQSASADAIQEDGKIVAGGGTNLGSQLPWPRFALARYKTDGSLDHSFGRGGKVATKVGVRLGGRINALAVESDGKIVAAGEAYGGANYDFALVRYESDGSLDKSFGSRGKVMTALGLSESAHAVLLQPNGKIVVAGVAGADFKGICESGTFALVRYKTNGSLDTSFGGDGTVTTEVDDISSAVAAVLQPDGKIVAVGNFSHESAPCESESGGLALARYKKDGSLDPTFGSGGTVKTASQSASTVALQSDGKILVGGSALFRYNSNGSPDTTFGTGGEVVTPRFETAAIRLRPDGKILAVGVDCVPGKGCHLAFARYKTDGSPDTSFGTGGTVVTTEGGGYDIAVALQANGRIVVAGHFRGGFAVARYKPDGSPDASLGKRGKVTTSFTVCAVPKVKGKGLQSATRAIENARCSLGKVTRAFSPTITKGRVLAQKPRPGVWRKPGTKVSLVVSKGPR